MGTQSNALVLVHISKSEIGYDRQIPDSHKHKLDSVGVVISTCLKQRSGNIGG